MELLPGHEPATCCQGGAVTSAGSITNQIRNQGSAKRKTRSQKKSGSDGATGRTRTGDLLSGRSRHERREYNESDSESRVGKKKDPLTKKERV